MKSQKSFFKKITVIFVILLVMGSVGSAVFWRISGILKNSDPGVPPFLTMAPAGALKGSYVEPSQGLLKFEDSDKIAYSSYAARADVMAKFPVKGFLVPNINYMFVDRDGVSMDDVVKGIDPVTNRMLVVYYKPEEGKWYSYPQGPFVGTVTLAKDQLSHFLIPRNQGVVIISEVASTSLGLLDARKMPTSLSTSAPIDAALSGWVLVGSAKNTVVDTIAPYKERVSSVWVLSDPSSTSNAFVKVANADYSNTSVFSTYHMAWVYLVPASASFTAPIATTTTVTTTDTSVADTSSTVTTTTTTTVDNSPLIPKISTFSLDKIYQGHTYSTFLVNGANFDSSSVVSAPVGSGITFSHFVLQNDKSVTATMVVTGTAVPGSVDITVTTLAGSDKKSLMVLAKADPTIFSIAPTSTYIGDTSFKQLTFTGTNLGANLASKVLSDSTGVILGSVISQTPTSITLKASLNTSVVLGKKQFTVENESGIINVSDKFEVVAAPIPQKIPATMVAPVTKDVGDQKVTVTWVAPQSDSPVTTYVITPVIMTPKVIFGTPIDVKAPATEYTFNNLTNGTAYTFIITATSAVGTSLPSLASGSVTPVAPVVAESTSIPWGKVIFDGYGTVTWNSLLSRLTMSPKAATQASETHSALVVSDQILKQPYTLNYTVKTTQQLRTGSVPNPWEVAWAVFGYTSDGKFKYLILKPNGYGLELGESLLNNVQNFLYTSPKDQDLFPITSSYDVQIHVANNVISVTVNGKFYFEYTISAKDQLTPDGQFGFYTEDAAVQITNIITQ